MNLQILGEMRVVGLLEVRLPVIVMSSLSEMAYIVLPYHCTKIILLMHFDLKSHGTQPKS